GRGDPLAADARVERCVTLERGNLACELLVLDGIVKPARIVTRTTMMIPGLVVDTVGDLDEAHQVVRAKLEAPFRPAEVEAAIFTQFALGVLAGMTTVRLLRRMQLSDTRPTVPVHSVDHHLVRRRARHVGRLRKADGFADSPDDLPG